MTFNSMITIIIDDRAVDMSFYSGEKILIINAIVTFQVPGQGAERCVEAY